MADFYYVAVNRQGKQVKGNVDAPDLRGATNLLKGQDLTIIRLQEATLLNREIKLEFGGKVKSRDIGIFCRQMNSILNAGVPVVRALEMLAEQTEKKKLKEAIELTRDNVSKGESLAVAMRQSDKVFPGILVSLVQAGEESGSLDIAFERMATHFEKQAKLSGMVKKAMIYPIIIMIVAVVVVGIMSVVVIPQFAAMFEDMGSELPLITKMVMGMSDFIMHRWYLIIIAVAAIVIGLKYYLSTDNGRHVWGRISLKIPVFGMLSVKSNCANFARTMATLMASGMDVPRALEITSGSLKNALFQDALLHAKKDVEQGIPMSEPLKASGLFPSMVYNMIAIGEETGMLDGMLTKVADYYEEEVELTTGSLTAAMEPLIIVVLGVIVGFIVLAIYMPMVSMYQGMDSL